ncbi:FAD-binding domain-containing protein [Trametes versicolor FP-101664 SS1]|uniref:FAD-binding domain-containing protein n=1 Tax=Trametes versicolor (strain FP-101664) TaxID=717944 RepID=UPI0004624904|nr:FAD-binding domain-containing protein [Trametes versicolor FP-101664 SS1]EIW57346.1 FAD-binding domain-containing protein [Trametes versicolor FP-101664 SS1]
MRLLGVFALQIALSIPAGYAANIAQCRCLFGNDCWPSQSDFDSLAQKVSQPLIHPTPFAQPCYVDANSAECAAIIANQTDSNLRADQPGAMQEPNFETFTFPNGTIDACYLNVTLGIPCHQGSVSVIGVDARTVEDIQVAVTFAAEHNLRLAVKNTGHDFFGRSDSRGSFVIWTHHMNNFTVHQSFQPTAALSNETYEFALTVEAGVQWHEAYSAADASGRTIVGGVTAGGSVGAAGGWPAGGGHSALTPTFGLGVDNILEMTLVTANGTFLAANPHINPDLFWALRGGGGGTYGIVTSVTYRTHPRVPVIGAFLGVGANASQPTAALLAAFTELVRITPNLTDAGWGGYTDIVPAFAGGGAVGFSITYILPNVSWAAANATIQPYFDFVNALAANSSGDAAPTVLSFAFTQQYTSFFDWYNQNVDETGGVGFNLELGSWLLPRSTLEGNPQGVAATVLGTTAGYYLVAGGAASRVDPDAAGINPAWRKAAVHVVGGATWADGTTSHEINALRAALSDRNAQLRSLAPESGAYFNEASPFEPDFKQAFFGSHYDRLRAIKGVYDPQDLFIVTEGVASDEWDSTLNCRI